MYDPGLDHINPGPIRSFQPPDEAFPCYEIGKCAGNDEHEG